MKYNFSKQLIESERDHHGNNKSWIHVFAKYKSTPYCGVSQVWFWWKICALDFDDFTIRLFICASKWESCGVFSCSCGVRQGDPFSPVLFFWSRRFLVRLFPWLRMHDISYLCPIVVASLFPPISYTLMMFWFSVQVLSVIFDAF